MIVASLLPLPQCITATDQFGIRQPHLQLCILYRSLASSRSRQGMQPSWRDDLKPHQLPYPSPTTGTTATTPSFLLCRSCPSPPVQQQFSPTFPLPSSVDVPHSSIICLILASARISTVRDHHQQVKRATAPRRSSSHLISSLNLQRQQRRPSSSPTTSPLLAGRILRRSWCS